MDRQDRGCNRVNVNLILRIRLRRTWSHVCLHLFDQSRPLRRLKKRWQQRSCKLLLSSCKGEIQTEGGGETATCLVTPQFLRRGRRQTPCIFSTAPKGLPRRNASLPRVKTLPSLNTAEYFSVREENCGWPTSRIWLSTKCEHWR